MIDRLLGFRLVATGQVDCGILGSQVKSKLKTYAAIGTRDYYYFPREIILWCVQLWVNATKEDIDEAKAEISGQTKVKR